MGKLSRRAWMKKIDEFLIMNGRATLDWSTVLGLEGGYGKSKIKTVKDALDKRNEGTWPYIWFSSGQTDYSVYGRYDYLYSLLFGRQISANTIALTIKTLEAEREEVNLIDWGGTIFTALDLVLSPAIRTVTIVNYDGPQLDFARWILGQPQFERYLDYVFVLGEDYVFRVPGRLRIIARQKIGTVFLFSEVLEHLKKVTVYWDRVDDTFGIDRAFVANSFCTPAYGHHVPIIIDGQTYSTVRTANKAWRKAMEERGYRLRKVEGWNSRLWELNRECGRWGIGKST